MRHGFAAVLLDYHDHPYSFELHLANGGLIYFEVRNGHGSRRVSYGPSLRNANVSTFFACRHAVRLGRVDDAVGARHQLGLRGHVAAAAATGRLQPDVGLCATHRAVGSDLAYAGTRGVHEIPMVFASATLTAPSPAGRAVA